MEVEFCAPHCVATTLSPRVLKVAIALTVLLSVSVIVFLFVHAYVKA